MEKYKWTRIREIPLTYLLYSIVFIPFNLRNLLSSVLDCSLTDLLVNCAVHIFCIVSKIDYKASMEK